MVTQLTVIKTTPSETRTTVERERERERERIKP